MRDQESLHTEQLVVPVAASSEGGLTIAGFSRAPLPEVSLASILRLAGALAAGGAGPLSSVGTRVSAATPLGRDPLRMAAEVLVRSGLASVSPDGQLSPSPLLMGLDQALQQEDLDGASRVFCAYRPYAIVLAVLYEAGSIDRNEAHTVLRERVGGGSREAIARLLRFPVYLGQAWTDGGVIRDGSARSSEDEVVNTFVTSFAYVGREGLASVEELLVAICRALRSAPWFIARRIGDALARGRLSEFVFQAAAGRPIRRIDEIVRGSLVAIRLEPVPIDRLHIAGKPVFSVSRRQP